MPPSSTPQVLLSPAELSYIHTSLSLSPPIRTDGRTATEFRPLVAETNILPGTNGSARICFADGTEAIVGVKAEIERAPSVNTSGTSMADDFGEAKHIGLVEGNEEKTRTRNAWVEVNVELPGYRDDDAMPIFLAAILSEALLADGQYPTRLSINRRFNWKLYIDILLLSQPLSYPLPLLSLTSHLALLSTRLPRLISEDDDDPLFDDDWEASVHLYPPEDHDLVRPPVTLLVMAVKDNIFFDPTREELAVAEVVLAVSVSEAAKKHEKADVDSKRNLRLLAVRTIDPPSRLTHPGVPNALNVAIRGIASNNNDTISRREVQDEEGVWQPPRGGAKRTIFSTIIHQVLVTGGVAEEVLDGLDAVKLG